MRSDERDVSEELIATQHREGHQPYVRQTLFLLTDPDLTFGIPASGKDEIWSALATTPSPSARALFELSAIVLTHVVVISLICKLGEELGEARERVGRAERGELGRLSEGGK